MKSNPIKALLAQGKPTIGSWVTMGSLPAAEIMSLVGFDWLLVDCEHGPMDFEKAQALFQAIDASYCAPFIRVADNDAALIKRALDIGAMGVIVPMVNDRASAERAVRAAKYPPEGIRGIGAGRAQRYGLDFEDYLERANEEIMVILQIEHRSAVEHIDEIVAVPGIDVLFIGPADLSGSYGYKRLHSDLPVEVAEAIDKVVTSARRAGVALGMWVADAEATNQRIEQGFQFLGLAADHLLLVSACEAALRGVRRDRTPAAATGV